MDHVKYLTTSVNGPFFLVLNNYYALTLYFSSITRPPCFKHVLFFFRIDPLHDDVKNQNKPGALCIVGFIGGPLRDSIMIIPPF